MPESGKRMPHARMNLSSFNENKGKELLQQDGIELMAKAPNVF